MGIESLLYFFISLVCVYLCMCVCAFLHLLACRGQTYWFSPSTLWQCLNYVSQIAGFGCRCPYLLSNLASPWFFKISIYSESQQFEKTMYYSSKEPSSVRLNTDKRLSVIWID